MAARASKVDRVVYSSSASVYGNPRTIPINEDDPLWTLSPYAVSKLGGENYCTAFAESYGLRVDDRPLLERLRPGPAPGQSLLRRRLEVPRRGARRASRSRSTATASRRATTPTSTTRSRRHPRGCHPSARGGRGLQCRHGDRDVGEPSLAATIGVAMDVTVAITHVDRRDIDNIRRRVVNIEKIRRMLALDATVDARARLVETAAWLLERRASRCTSGQIVSRDCEWLCSE